MSDKTDLIIRDIDNKLAKVLTGVAEAHKKGIRFHFELDCPGDCKTVRSKYSDIDPNELYEIVKKEFENK